MIEKEAIAEANRRNEARKDVFCPKINGMCKINCECYEKAVVKNAVVKHDGSNYWVFGGYCTCHDLKAELI